MSRKVNEPDPHYEYEATQQDLLFLTGLKGSPFTVQDFELLINLFERENGEDGTPKPLPAFALALDKASISKPKEELEKIYEVKKE